MPASGSGPPPEEVGSAITRSRVGTEMAQAGGGTVYLRFLGPVDQESCARLVAAVDEAAKLAPAKLVLLLSTPGGGVFEGISVYNCLKMLPFDVDTHNFGQVDSIGSVLYSAGKKRTSPPSARFLLHAVQANFQGNVALEEPQLIEPLSGLQADAKNIARIVADAAGKSVTDIEGMMLKRTSLFPEDAKELGLVHEVGHLVIPPGAVVLSVQKGPQIVRPPFQVVQAESS